jgi:hypothetical protein
MMTGMISVELLEVKKVPKSALESADSMATYTIKTHTHKLRFLQHVIRTQEMFGLELERARSFAIGKVKTALHVYSLLPAMVPAIFMSSIMLSFLRKTKLLEIRDES